MNSDIFMHFGFPVDEDDEIWFGHSKLKVGIILENRFEVDRQMTSDVRYGLVALGSKVSRDAQLVELCMKVDWIRRPELNTFWVEVGSIWPGQGVFIFTDFVFNWAYFCSPGNICYPGATPEIWYQKTEGLL